MNGSGKSSSIAGSFSTLLLRVWEKWDVRGMVLFSLTLQIVLSVLGSRRKYTIKPFFKTILWFAYLSADWIAIATLGKLSSSYTETPTTNVLRAYWAPLLLLHLGGPDTITAYAFEDNKLWIRHLLILVVKAIFVVYIICLFWTFSWLSFLSFPLILARIIKYVEKILCLKLNNSQKTKSVISNIFNSRGHRHSNMNQILDHLLKENPTVLRGYLLFTIMRPDVNDYLSSHSLSSTNIRIQTCVKDTTDIDDPLVLFEKFDYLFDVIRSNFLDIFAVELEFIFDVVYTKAALIYTKLGCLLRVTSFVSSFSVLLLFFISIINEPKFYFSRVDLAITGILLTGAIALELYAAWVMLSSDWAILVAAFHHNMLVRRIFRAALKSFSWLLHRSKRWSNHIGQFDLLKYCWLYKKKKANQSFACGILWQITNDNDFIEMLHKCMCTNFVQVPPYLKNADNFLEPIISFILSDSFWPSRGEKALKKASQDRDLGWSIELDFDYCIIIWHLATSVCYHQELQGDDNEAKKISKHVSDYMMYLLAMCPSLILPDHSKSFWLDHTYDNLKELLFSATDDITNAASILLSNPDNVCEEELESSESTVENLQGEASPAIDIRNAAPALPSNPDKDELKSSEITFKNLRRDVFKLATSLKQSDNKWKMMMDVWIEMLVYAAISSQHISHVKQLGDGIEFLSLIWLFVGLNFIFQSLEGKSIL